MGRRKKTHEQFKQEMKLKHPNIEVLGQYQGGKFNIDCECKICGYKWSPRPNNLLSGKGCPICKKEQADKKETKSHGQFVKELQEKHPNIIPLNKYINATTEIDFKCLVHNNIFTTTPDSILHAKYGCPICSQIGRSKKRTKSHEQFINEMRIKNKKVQVLEEYKGVKVEIKCRCLIHNEIFYSTPNDLLQGRGCHKCKFEHFIGETNPRYNPNLTDEEREHNRKTKEYQDFVKNTLEYFDYTCQITNKRGGDLVVHHLNGYNWYVEGRMDINNVIVITKELHDKFHHIYGYGYNTKEQWEEFINNNNNNNKRDVI